MLGERKQQQKQNPARRKTKSSERENFFVGFFERERGKDVYPLLKKTKLEFTEISLNVAFGVYGKGNVKIH